MALTMNWIALTVNSVNRVGRMARPVARPVARQGLAGFELVLVRVL